MFVPVGRQLLALEVVWFRFLTMFVLSTTLAASLMLAMVLAAIALGGLVGIGVGEKNPHAAAHLPAIAFAAGTALVASYAGFRWLTSGAQILAWSNTLWLAFVLTFPVSALSGVFFTLVGDALERVIDHETRSVGLLALANTAGGMCGPLVAAFLMLPSLGQERAFFTLAVAYLGIGGVARYGVGLSTTGRLCRFSRIGIAITVALDAFPFGTMRDVYFQRVASPTGPTAPRLSRRAKVRSETLFLMQQKWMGSRSTAVW